MLSLVEQLKHDEGTQQHVYKCTAGYWTIGTGRNLETKGISIIEADYLLQNDIKECIDHLKEFPWYTMQPADVQEALLNMCFNMGLTGLLKFKRMINALKQKDYGTAAHEALGSKWASQVGQRAIRIANVFRDAGR